jgi:hypothetical protein
LVCGRHAGEPKDHESGEPMVNEERSALFAISTALPLFETPTWI